MTTPSVDLPRNPFASVQAAWARLKHAGTLLVAYRARDSGLPRPLFYSSSTTRRKFDAAQALETFLAQGGADTVAWIASPTVTDAVMAMEPLRCGLPGTRAALFVTAAAVSLDVDVWKLLDTMQALGHFS